MVNKKIKFLDATLSLSKQISYDKYMTYDSSAFYLQQALEQYGIVLPKKLFYMYKFPGGKDMWDYYHEKHEKWMFVQWYERYINKGMKIRRAVLKNSNEVQFNLRDFFRFMFSLALVNKNDLKKFFADKYSELNKELRTDIAQIRKLNPELQCVKNYNNADFLLGVMFGFAPEDIDYFIGVHHTGRGDKYEKDSNRLREKVWKNFRCPLTYVLSPQNLQMVENAVDGYVMTKALGGYEKI